MVGRPTWKASPTSYRGTTDCRGGESLGLPLTYRPWDETSWTARIGLGARQAHMGAGLALLASPQARVQGIPQGIAQESEAEHHGG